MRVVVEPVRVEVETDEVMDEAEELEAELKTPSLAVQVAIWVGLSWVSPIWFNVLLVSSEVG